MPPPPYHLTDADAVKFFRDLPSGSYRLEIMPWAQAFSAPEGAWYFALGDNTFVVCRDVRVQDKDAPHAPPKEPPA